ncbi:UDP-N-acetylglucosamine 2-epimerase (non-hydrolyzing) [Candidatus Pelagibacter sp.]|nr:UDP-N-acetylglucosamine 2-epimerase (non-hydrolyzing) [Candidatus Pelagibacter sp.]
MKIITILGARPQFIKAGSMSREINRQKDLGVDVTEVIIHTGQHYDTNMSDVFFEEMQIPKPNYFLGIGGKTHGAMTGQMIEKIEPILVKEKPDCVLVYGDTNSTLAGAIASSKLNLKIAHVEAGLRSFNLKMPEEVNRILTDRVSNILFCPTDSAVENLKNESFSNWCDNIENVGDIMLDSALYYKEKALIPKGLEIKKNFILATIHRAENTDSPETLKNIVSQFNKLAEQIEIVLPLHPRTKKKIEINKLKLYDNINVIAPVSYLNMLYLLNNCKLVVTDSGGLQKEAYFFKKPCITVRSETEWTELVECGANKLISLFNKNLIDAYFEMINFNNFSNSFYGNGDTASRIFIKLNNLLNK